MELKIKIVKKLNKILKKINSINYFFRYIFKIYRIDPKLQVLEIYLEDIGVKSVSQDDFYYTFIFNDDTEFKFWNVNRWYGFMSRGEAKFSNGKSFDWNSVMPPRSVLFKYKKFVKKYEKIDGIGKKRKKSDDFSEYLPTKLVRKNKLKKIGNK